MVNFFFFGVANTLIKIILFIYSFHFGLPLSLSIFEMAKDCGNIFFSVAKDNSNI